MIEVVYRNAEMGYWSADKCQYCGIRPASEFIPLKSGPETPEEYRRIRMIRQIYNNVHVVTLL